MSLNLESAGLSVEEKWRTFLKSISGDLSHKSWLIFCVTRIFGFCLNLDTFVHAPLIHPSAASHNTLHLVPLRECNI